MKGVEKAGIKVAKIKITTKQICKILSVLNLESRLRTRAKKPLGSPPFGGGLGGGVLTHLQIARPWYTSSVLN
ncbi:hypothetical protein [Candidatus Similichlamydia epinepheli]|uniref:hypothetical protein n=1 Tax=Candidatus Similichlamydia epinepheli TaxID=1903953 RepID=UPI000D36C4B1|nr:hypothetical protein [Candidatus Similichlamydia epinepheli]